MTALTLGSASARLDVRKVLERIANRILTGPVILMYHRVADVGADPWSIAVSPANFAEHLQVLRRHCEPLPLGKMADLLRERRLPPRAVGLSFDDGYADNLHNAKPLCARYDVPGTVFVTTGTIGAAREFFWDELERILLEPGTLPRELVLQLGGRTHRWSLGDDAIYTAEACQRHRTQQVGDPAPTRRHAVYAELYRLIDALPFAARELALDALRAWAQLPPSDRRLAHPMDADEIRSLADGRLVEVGAHGVTHRALSALPSREQAVEIRDSKRVLEEILGAPVAGFTYPHGRLGEPTAQIAREAGFAYACSTVNRSIRPSADPYAIPRVFVKNWNGEQFAKRLSRHIRGIG